MSDFETERQAIREALAANCTDIRVIPVTQAAERYRDRVPRPVGYSYMDLRRDRAHRMALTIHDHTWNAMHDYGIEEGRDSPEYRGRRAVMLRAWARVREVSRG